MVGSRDRNVAGISVPKGLSRERTPIRQFNHLGVEDMSPPDLGPVND